MVAKKTDLELAELGKDVCQRQRIIECARIEQGLRVARELEGLTRL
jgi:hypothetical protein